MSPLHSETGIGRIRSVTTQAQKGALNQVGETRGGARKTALITGASSGIGLELARIFGGRGAM